MECYTTTTEGSPQHHSLLLWILLLATLKNMTVILVGHNVKVFDIPILLHALESCSLISIMQQVVKGFLDTKKLFKLTHPNMSSYPQQYLAESLLQCSYNAHDAVEDVLILQKLVSSIPFSYVKSKHATFSLTSALETFDYQKR